MARIMEHYGPIDGIAGGSSASITSFFTESILSNPLVRQCGEDQCSRVETGERAALLFKSLFGYFTLVATESDEALAYAAVNTAAQRIIAGDLQQLAETDPEAALENLRTLLGSDDLSGMINPEVWELLHRDDAPLFVPDIIKGVLDAANWKVDDVRVFLRPGILDFYAFADRLGRMGTFYTGKQPADAAGIANWLDQCAAPSRGLTWDEVRDLPMDDDSTCGETFRGLVHDFRNTLLADEEAYGSRINDNVGDTDLTVLIVSALFAGPTAEALAEARQAYLDNPVVPTVFDPSFDDVRVGYWSNSSVLDQLTQRIASYPDLGSQRAHALGESTWREAIARSAGEPGLARGQELTDHGVTIAGWPNPLPVQALESVGCEVVIALTRRGGSGGFLHGVLSLAGGSEDDGQAFFGLAEGSSSVFGALTRADGVWCTDWDQPSQTDLSAMFDIGYDAPFESEFSWFLDEDRAYANVSADLGIPGCTPGVLD
jgi:hypothetical protein